MAGSLPAGTVTFLFTDIEGSTKLLQELGGDDYEEVLGAHNELLRGAFVAHGGHEVSTAGDSFFVAFERASDALAAALDGQLAIAAHDWGGAPVRVRMGLHTGEAQVAGDDYVGLAVHQAARIASAGHGGQVLVSQATTDLAGAQPEGAALVDLGDHRLKDLAQPTRLYKLSHGRLPTDLPPPRSLSVLPNNLPLQLTTFVGRDEETAKVRKLLGTARLVTLAGAGGSGKTRLALHVGADLATEYANGVWLVDLAAITDPGLIMRATAEALGVRQEQDRTADEVLVEHLQGRELLVVVDNCEHLAEDAAECIERLLHAAAALTVLATSREPLGAEGETVFRVPSLDTPPEHESAEVIASYEAVRLFCDRAQRVTQEFTLDRDNTPAVSEICRRLDGMPLAIELAAARVRMLTPQEIAKRLDDRFKLLTGGARTGFRRQQTLRAAVDWSYDLLADTEQRVFRRLAAFVGGFSLDAAEFVCAGDSIDASETFDVLSILVDRSLVVAEPTGGETRYRLLETMREYGREALAAAGEAPAVFHQHLAWYAALAEEAEPQLEGGGQAEWLERLDQERENIRQALSWATADGDAQTGVRLVTAMGRFWTIRSHLAEGAAWLEPLYEQCQDGVPLDLKAKVLLWLGALLNDSGKPEQARRAYEECVALPRGPGTLRWIGEALNDLAILVSRLEQDVEAGLRLLYEALEVRREAGHDYGVAETLALLAQTERWRGNYAEADRLFAESLATYERIGNASRVAILQANLAIGAAHQGDYNRALGLYEASRETARELGQLDLVASCLNGAGRIRRLMGDFADAERLHAEAEEIHRELDNSGIRDIGSTVRLQGQLEAARGRLEAARIRIEEFIRQVRASPDLAVFAMFGHLDLALLDYFADDVAAARKNVDDAMLLFETTHREDELAYLKTVQARITRAEGDVEGARGLFNEAAARAREVGRPAELAEWAHECGLLELEQDDMDKARELFVDALTLRHETCLLPAAVRTLEAFAWLEARAQRAKRAAVLLGAAAAMRDELGITMFPIDRPLHDDAVARVTTKLGDGFEAAWSEGAAMALDAAVALALADH